MSLVDILIALIPAFGLGFQVISMQLIGGKYTNKVMGMAIVTLIVGIIVYFIKQPVLTPALWIGSALSGIGFCIGIILQVKSFSLVGVTMTMPISVGEQLVGTALVGAICFHEWTSANQWLLGIGALVLIVGGIAMTAYHEKSEQGSNVKKGMLYLIISSLGFVAYASFPTAFKLSGWDVVFPQAVAIFVAMVILCAFEKDNQMFAKKTWQNMATGACFAIANLGIIFSNQINGVAVGYTISQLNVIISTLGGLWILHESKTPKEVKFTIAGVLLVVAGGIMIGITK
ncbi:GRP family sugar transporter [Limosilactobacillus caccae]|uniref:GRP family sugar transporter n=1 Tax=Limosilactobacillus caccae TaxID=1926284 RepID=UPI00097068FA|nr:GRP family sugar transporter [Limosilactobacillus caccae]